VVSDNDGSRRVRWSKGRLNNNMAAAVAAAARSSPRGTSGSSRPRRSRDRPFARARARAASSFFLVGGATKPVIRTPGCETTPGRRPVRARARRMLREKTKRSRRSRRFSACFFCDRPPTQRHTTQHPPSVHNQILTLVVQEFA